VGGSIDDVMIIIMIDGHFPQVLVQVTGLDPVEDLPRFFHPFILSVVVVVVVVVMD